LWSRTFGGSYYDFANSVQQTSDGGFVIAGEKLRDFLLIKTNTLGIVE